MTKPPERKPSWPWILGGCLLAGGPLLCGVMLAIAIPNYQQFGCKAKRAEARTSLQRLVERQRTFRAEHGFYTSDLKALGFLPEGERPQYLYGFVASGPADVDGGPPDHDPSRRDTSDPERLDARYRLERMRRMDGGLQSGRYLESTDLPPGAMVERDRFVAAAVGDISPDSNGELDVVTMDETGAFTVVTNDCWRN